jgi:hypothetical protein
MIIPGTEPSVGSVQMHHQYPTNQQDTQVINKQQALALWCCRCLSRWSSGGCTGGLRVGSFLLSK